MVFGATYFPVETAAAAAFSFAAANCSAYLSTSHCVFPAGTAGSDVAVKVRVGILIVPEFLICFAYSACAAAVAAKRGAAGFAGFKKASIPAIAVLPLSAAL